MNNNFCTIFCVALFSHIGWKRGKGCELPLKIKVEKKLWDRHLIRYIYQISVDFLVMLQMYGRGNYDFPVILKRKDEQETSSVNVDEIMQKTWQNRG